jgi:hypothetical protein
MTVSFITNMVLPGSGVKNVKKPQNFAFDVWDLYERVTGKHRPDHAPRPKVTT